MRKEWTLQEEQFLHENVGIKKLDTIAKNLGRTEASVKLKLNRMGIANTKEQTGYLTMGELAKVLKVDRKTVQNWADNHGLYFTKRITRHSKRFYLINIDIFWEWAMSHKEKITFSYFEPHSLPPEPSWVESEREKEKKHKKGKEYKPWTTDEIKRLKTLKAEGCTFKEIGERLNRSKNSIENKYKRFKNPVLS